MILPASRLLVTGHGRRLAATAACLAGLALVAACGGEGEEAATDRAPEGAPALSDTPAAAAPSGPQAELQQIQRKLTQIQQEAMQDSAIQAERADLQQTIEDEMAAANPETEARMARFDSLRGVLQTARSQGDTTRLRAAFVELQSLQRQLQQTQSRVMQQPELSARLDSFRAALLAEMEEVNPATDSLRTRADSLTARMQSRSGLLGGSADTAGADTTGGS